MPAGVNNVLRKFVLFVDGTDYRGDCESFKLPEMKMKLEPYRGGGMDMPVEVDLGIEDPVTWEFTLTSISEQVLEKWALAPNQYKSFTLRGSLIGHDGTRGRIKAQFSGIIKEVAMEEIKAGGKGKCKFTGTGDYFRLEKNGKVVWELDAINMKRIIGGVDQLLQDRVALGITTTG